VDDFSSHSRLFQKGGEVKGHVSHPRHLNGPSRMRSSREQFGRVRDRFRLEEARIAIFGFPDANNTTPICNSGGDPLP
jgi:hypothetical protein